MKLGFKIILPVLVLLVIILGVFGYLLYNLKQQEVVISAETSKIQKLNSLNERLSREQDVTVYNTLAYRFNQDKVSLLLISQAELDKAKTLDEMYPFITSIRGRELVISYIDSRKEVESLRNELVQAINEGNREQIDLSYNKWSIQTQNIKAALADIGAFNINSLEKTLALVESIRNDIARVITLLSFVVIATVFLLYLYLRFVITIPIIKLAQFVDEIANKNFTTTTTTTTTGINSKDEIGMLARAFNIMSVRLKEYYMELEQKVLDRTQDLEEAKAKDEAILTSIGDGLIVTDKDKHIVLVNKISEKLLGWSTVEIYGKLMDQVIPMFDGDRKVVSQSDRPITKSLEKLVQISSRTMSYKNKAGTIFPVAITVSPIIMGKTHIGAVEIFRDITHEKDIDKAKTEFVSLASHQLRTPLTAINWYSEMLANGDAGKLSSKQSQFVGEIHNGNNRLISLVNSLLNVSRIDLGTLAITPKKVKIDTICDEALKELYVQIKRKKQVIKTQYEDDLPQINADPTYIRIIFHNLLSNAVKYTPEKGKVTVKLHKENKHILFTVQDTGYGIPRKDQDKIFQKLYRADNAIKKETDGNGLGLYIVKSVVEKTMSGKVWFESVENKGTTFYVEIPLNGMKKVEGTKGLV